MITSILLAKMIDDDGRGIFKIEDKWIVLTHDNSLYENRKIQGFTDFAPGQSKIYSIVIDANMVTSDWNTNVYRFILAHEIGHIMLGHVDDRRGDSWSKERQADCYAVRALDKAGMRGVETAISYYDDIIDHPKTGRPGGISHIAFVKSCDN